MKQQTKTMTIRIIIAMMMLQFFVNEAVAQYVIGQKFTVSNGMKYIMANNQSGYYTMNVEVTNVKPNNEYEVKIYSDAYLKRPGTESVVNRFEIPQIVYKNGDSFTVTSVGKLKSSTEAYTAPNVTVTSIDLPPTVAVIDEYAFTSYESLTQVTGAHNLRTIRNSAFARCSKLESLPDVADLAFVEEIEDYAFYFCDNFHIANLTSIKKLGKGSFSVRSGSNYGLSTLVLGDQLAGSIPEDCFNNNKLLTSVEIPAGVNSIEKNAFSSCSNLKTITVHATIPPTLDNQFQRGSTIYVPFGCKNLYSTADGWKEYNIVEFGRIDVTGISLSQGTLNFTAAGQTATLTAIVAPSNATNKSITWTSSNRSVATVDANGNVTAVANGTTTVTARTNDGSNLSATCSVTVDISELSGFSNYKLYTLACKRGGLVMNDNGTGLAAGQKRTDAPEVDKRFAIITYNGGYYLYSPTVKKFLLADGSFVNGLGSPITFDNSHPDGNYMYMLTTQDTEGTTLFFNNNGDIVICDWWTPDDGNRWLIEPVSDFDPTEALTIASNQVYKVTYEVLYKGNVVATATEEVPKGSVLPSPPASLSNNFVSLTKFGTHPTTITKNETIQFTATWDGPFEFSESVDNAKWYNMHIYSGWYVGKQASEPYYPIANAGDALNTKEYQWAFGGDPYHIKVYNRTSGFAETLTKDGENVVMRIGDYSWDILPNNDGFVLREMGTSYNCINQYTGGGGPLKTWNHYDCPTNVASTFRVEEVQQINDVVVVTDISQLDNAIYIEQFAAKVGENTQMEICLKNAEAATAYVFDLVLPEGITVATNDKGKYIDELSDRHDDHTRTINYKGENIYSLSTLSGNSEELTGNDGAIRLVTIAVSDNMAEGNYAIDIKNASYSKPDGTLVSLPDVRAVVTVEDYVLGDVNGNGGVDIGDAVSIVNYLVGKDSSNFVAKAADTNKNEQIDIGDAVTIVNLLVGKITSLTRELNINWDDKNPE